MCRRSEKERERWILVVVRRVTSLLDVLRPLVARMWVARSSVEEVVSMVNGTRRPKAVRLLGESSQSDGMKRLNIAVRVPATGWHMQPSFSRCTMMYSRAFAVEVMLRR
eukprot:3295350-Ditylum_brightwellii.AAC.1